MVHVRCAYLYWDNVGSGIVDTHRYRLSHAANDDYRLLKCDICDMFRFCWWLDGWRRHSVAFNFLRCLHWQSLNSSSRETESVCVWCVSLSDCAKCCIWIPIDGGNATNENTFECSCWIDALDTHNQSNSMTSIATIRPHFEVWVECANK